MHACEFVSEISGAEVNLKSGLNGREIWRCCADCSIGNRRMDCLRSVSEYTVRFVLNSL